MTGFWKNKRIFITGHTGFKGSWLSLWLINQGADVYGYALEPDDNVNLFLSLGGAQFFKGQHSDVRDFEKLQEAITCFQPEIIFHLAAQPLVQTSYLRPIDTYSTNVMGSVNLLEAARHNPSTRVVINVTTDKCYENQEWCWGYRENEAMGGHDPYSASKGCSELLTSSYIKSYYKSANIGLASARAGNVIGGGDWAIDRLVPDLIKGLHKGNQIKIRNPSSIRPWQHVLEPLSGYITLAEKLYNNPINYSEAWNFGPNDTDVKKVEWVANKICKLWEKNSSWTTDSDQRNHEAQFLKLDISKAKTQLYWQPRWSVEEALVKTVEWYRGYYAGSNIKTLTLSQIEQFDKII
jgi:CDP-glucose 4,6-dehydratase